MFTNFKRVFNFALADFYRNKGISIAAIFVLIITITLVTGLFYIYGVGNFIILQVQNKIDITAYFKAETTEQEILDVKDQVLKSLQNVTSVKYVSKEQALVNFTQRHKDNSVFSQALEQVGDNPFLASLNIATNGSSLQYEQVAKILQSENFSNLIEKVDFSEKKDTIDKVFSIMSNVTKFGLGAALILLIVALLVVFNTIKLAIENSKEEISTMRIVGASSWFVRAPFIIQGALFGCISFAICLVVTILLSYFLSSGFALVTGGFSLWDYLIRNLWLIILIQAGFGIGFGVTTSFIVVQKYLKI